MRPNLVPHTCVHHSFLLPKAEERVSVVFAKKKSVAAEKKQKKEQRDEAERHKQRQAELVSQP